MATDATGTPTTRGIPKFNTAVDAPSGKGSNAQMDSIDTLLPTFRVRKNSGGSTFERKRLNLIEGSGVTLTIADDATDDEVDVTVAASVTAPGGWEIIEELDLNSTGVTSTLPTTYDSLKIVWKARSGNAGTTDALYVRFNADSGPNYDYTSLVGNNAATTSGTVTGQAQLAVGLIPFTSATANRFGTGEILIPDYRGADHKNAVSTFHSPSTSSAANMWTGQYGGVWLSTAAITAVTLIAQGGGNMSAGSRAWVYGLKGV